MATSTPWGPSQQSEKITRGIVSYSTAGHGGIHVSPKLNQQIPAHLRIEDGWYEEDCDWARVCLAFPHLFSQCRVDAATASLRAWYPDAYEAHFGVILEPGESYAKDQREFAVRHEQDLIVVSASLLQGDGTTVVAFATRGGVRKSPEWEEGQTFHIARDEYDARGPYGFIIDPAKHFPRGSHV
jgi:hypothetical protein